MQIGDDRVGPHRPRLPFTLFPEQGPGMKAVSPLSLESRDLFWLLRWKRLRGQLPRAALCVCAIWLLGLSLVSSIALRLIPQPARQPPHSVDEFWSGWCDVFVIRAACGGQSGKLGFGGLLHLWFTWLLALPCGNVGQAQQAMSRYIFPLEGRASCQLNHQLVCSTVL